MQLQPLEDEASGAWWECAAYMAIANGHGDLEFAVRSVKVRRVVVAIEDCDRDSEKTGDDGHVAMVERLREWAL
jgi:hypothetical protein